MVDEDAAHDLATLWTVVDGTRCILSPVDGGWRLRLERLGVTFRARVVVDGSAALAVADEWSRQCG